MGSPAVHLRGRSRNAASTREPRLGDGDVLPPLERQSFRDRQHCSDARRLLGPVLRHGAERLAPAGRRRLSGMWPLRCQCSRARPHRRARHDGRQPGARRRAVEHRAHADRGRAAGRTPSSRAASISGATCWTPAASISATIRRGSGSRLAAVRASLAPRRRSTTWNSRTGAGPAIPIPASGRTSSSPALTSCRGASGRRPPIRTRRGRRSPQAGRRPTPRSRRVWVATCRRVRRQPRP